MRKANWLLKNRDGAFIHSDAGSEWNPLMERLLSARGFHTEEEANRFLHTDHSVFHDPFSMKDMEIAARRVIRAIKDGEPIIIFGDYDADGVTSTALLLLYLRANGSDPAIYIPDRLTEGYGMKEDSVKKLCTGKKQLMITVDNGVTAVAEIALAKSLGTETVVTDHHDCHGALPDAYAVVDPMRPDDEYPFRPLAGVGVVFKLVCAMEALLCRDADKNALYERMLDRYGDLVAIGTVADVMPLTDENRYIVSRGLAVASTGKRPGITALIEHTIGMNDRTARYPKAVKPLLASNISFHLAPRINAAGRVASAESAVKLFVTDSESEAKKLSEKLCEWNSIRQAKENEILRDAISMIEAERLNDGTRKMIILHKEGWHVGLIGIVASRITERYHLPSVLISFQGDEGKGSGRSVPGLDLSAALHSCSDLLLRCGGHELAAGLSISRDQLPAFIERMNAFAAQKLEKTDLAAAILEIDCQAEAKDLSVELAECVSQMEPFGIGNPQPVLLSEEMRVVSVIPLSGGKHTKFLLEKDGVGITALAFNRSPSEFGIAVSDRISVVYNIGINDFQGTRTVQMLLKDYCFDGETENIIANEEDAYRRYLGDHSAFLSGNELPSREECGLLYRVIKSICGDSKAVICPRMLEIKTANGSYLSANKIRLIMDILSEIGVLSLRYPEYAPYRVTVAFPNETLRNKTTIEKSATYRRLRSPSDSE